MKSGRKYQIQDAGVEGGTKGLANAFQAYRATTYLHCVLFLLKAQGDNWLLPSDRATQVR